VFEDIWAALVGDIWFELTLLLAIAIATNFLFARFGQPKIIGQILLGIAIGPSFLGLITVSESPDSGDIVRFLGLLGAIILLFMIGLECKIKEIYTKRAIIIALGGVIVPWIGGFLLAIFMLPTPDPILYPNITIFAESVFIGAALVATSVAITAGVMKEMGIISSNVAKTILGAAVVDDVLGMIVLAISRGLSTGTGIDALELLWVILIAIIFVAVGAYVGSRYLSKLIIRIEERGSQNKLPESGFLVALSFAFLYAFIAETIGISAIVGAFVAGTSLAGCQYAPKFRERTTVLEWVFAPIFFLSMGVLVNLAMPDSMWAFAIILIIVAFFTKVIGCGFPARRLGMSKDESLSIGVGMAPRLEVAMIIALYGLTAGIITRDVYSVIVVMGVVTALFTPSILRRTMKNVPKSPEMCEPKELKRKYYEKIEFE